MAKVGERINLAASVASLFGLFWPSWLTTAIVGSAGIGMAYLWSLYYSMPFPYLVAAALVVIAAAIWSVNGVAFLVQRRRQSGEKKQPATLPPAIPIAGLEELGRTRDGVAMMRSGDRLFEFDGLAYQHYQGRDRNDQEAIRRALIASERAQITRWDLTQILSNQGEAIQDEPVFRRVQVRPTRSTRFCTRTQISRMPSDEQAAVKSNRDLWRWYKDPMWDFEAEKLLAEGADLMAPPPPPPLGPGESLLVRGGTLLAQAELRRQQLPEWVNKVRAYFVKYQ